MLPAAAACNGTGHGTMHSSVTDAASTVGFGERDRSSALGDLDVGFGGHDRSFALWFLCAHQMCLQ